MVGEHAASNAVARARRLPSLRVGLHIVLVEGRAVLEAQRLLDVVDAAGRFRPGMVRTALDVYLRPGVRRQLAAEITAQFEAFRSTGLLLDHVNAHKHFHLHQLHIVADCHNNGIGSLLIRDLLERAETSGRAVVLNVIRGNRATSLYRRLGFRVVGEDREKLRMRWEQKPPEED